jgi:hypothetical protein
MSDGKKSEKYSYVLNDLGKWVLYAATANIAVDAYVTGTQVGAVSPKGLLAQRLNMKHTCKEEGSALLVLATLAHVGGLYFKKNY